MAKKNDVKKALTDGLRVGPLRRDQHQALRMHRLMLAQEQRQIEAIQKQAHARYLDLVMGAVEAHGVDATNAADFSAADVVDEKGRVFYEFRADKQPAQPGKEGA